ncbi:hypothetical protein RJT34_21512 [Clitoria ternatea]|uniref:Uncharacterized protein n=1 Tax=Clitoria ternatea TaxID=43366 RepID=A0AAN9P659_CLITE
MSELKGKLVHTENALGIAQLGGRLPNTNLPSPRSTLNFGRESKVWSRSLTGHYLCNEKNIKVSLQEAREALATSQKDLEALESKHQTKILEAEAHMGLL